MNILEIPSQSNNIKENPRLGPNIYIDFSIKLLLKSLTKGALGLGGQIFIDFSSKLLLKNLTKGALVLGAQISFVFLFISLISC